MTKPHSCAHGRAPHSARGSRPAAENRTAAVPRTGRWALATWGLLATLGAPACQTASHDRAPAHGPGSTSVAPRPAPILHIVLIRLKNPLDTAELSDDSLAAAAQIPSVASAFAGLHLETGRETITRDYDLCFTLGFDTRDDLEAYTSHPAHAALLEKWRDRIEWLRIHDAQDVRP